MPTDSYHGPCTTSSESRQPLVNLDWTRDPPPFSLTPWQQVIRNVDWSKTSIGPMSQWSRELRQTILMMMAETKPVILYWGLDCTIVYNEAHVPLLPGRHPAILGMKAADVFPEFWTFFDNVLTEQRQTGLTRVGEAAMLLMDRTGYLEETYFDWKIIPIIGENGQMVAGYGEPSEASFEIIGKRRVASIQNLSKRMAAVDTFAGLCQSTMETLQLNDRDFPLALLYSVERLPSSPDPSIQSPGRCRLEHALGVPDDHPCAPKFIALHQASDRLEHAMLEAMQGQVVVEVTTDDKLRTRFEGVSWRGFGLPSEEFVVVPIESNGIVDALLVLGANPHLRLDKGYRDYIEMMHDVLSAQEAKLHLAEEIRKRAEAASTAAMEFKKSELKFSRFAERSLVGLALTDVQGKILYANDAWLNFTGLQNSNLDFVSWLDSIYEEDIPSILDHWHQVSVLQEVVTFQIRSKVPFESGDMKSDHRTAICAVYPDLDENGNVSTVMGLVLDISEQKWVEQQLLLRKHELEASEARYRNFAERSPHGVVQTDQQGFIQFGNQAWHDFYGFKKGQVKNAQPWIEHLDAEDREKAKEYFDLICASESGVPHTVEVRHKRRVSVPLSSDYELVEMWIMATGWSERRADGSIDHIVFWVTDITAQKAATRVLQNKMEEAIRMKTQQERFIDMISHEIRNPLSAVLHCGEEIVESMKRCLTAMDAFPSPDQLAAKHGTLYQLTRDQVNNSMDAANTIMYCVQHQKQIVDDVLTLSKLDSDLLVVTPIPVQPTEIIRSVMKIFESEAKASDIVLQVDTSTTLDDTQVDWIMLDPNRFLQIVINLVTNAIKFTRNSKVRRILITVSMKSSRPPQDHNGVHYVPQRLDSPQNSHFPRGDTEMALDDALYLCFSVTDTGKGLTEMEQKLLFKRFAQASPKTHAEYGGSGLGLFISRQITELLGGEIGVGSGPEGGCKFAFYVKSYRVPTPKRRASLGPATVEAYAKTLVSPAPESWVAATTKTTTDQANDRNNHPPSSPAQPSTVIQRKVLVVEDNLINQKVLCKQLRSRGFEVEAANHGEEALDILEKYLQANQSGLSPYFDVILCDIEMPIMDGIECVTEIRSRENAGLFPGHVPIIGVTANVRSTQVNTAIEVGMDGVTTKPYRIDELIAHIDRVCVDVHTSVPQSSL